MTFHEKMFHICLGLHSGFPSCCIAHFVNDWWPNRFSAQNEQHWKNIKEVEQEAGPIWYVPCPKCLANRTFVQVHACESRECQQLIDRLQIMRKGSSHDSHPTVSR